MQRNTMNEMNKSNSPNPATERRSWLRNSCLLLMLVFLFASQVNATVVYTDVVPDLTITPAKLGEAIVFNPGTQQYAKFDQFVEPPPPIFPQFVIYYNYANPGDPIMIVGAGVGGQAVNQPGDGNLLKLPLGSVIGTALTFEQYSGYLATNWSGGGEGIVGFTIASGYYGWARLNVQNTPGVGLSVTLLDFAVEDQPGVPITSPGAAPPSFTGFFPPVDNPPMVNLATAGSAIPVKFSLGGNKGLDIFVAGYPASQPVACDSGAPLDEIEQTVTAGASSLSYDATTDRYTYVWKTDKAWKGTCRQLSVKLKNGTTQVANFKFK